MLKKFGLPILALAAMLAFVPAQAKAAHWSFGIGVAPAYPVYPYAYSYPYYSPYYTPYYYNSPYAYSYPYYGGGVYFGGHHRDRDDWHERGEHFRGRDHGGEHFRGGGHERGGHGHH
jgi:hypothetical protein